MESALPVPPARQDDGNVADRLPDAFDRRYGLGNVFDEIPRVDAEFDRIGSDRGNIAGLAEDDILALSDERDSHKGKRASKDLPARANRFLWLWSHCFDYPQT